MNTTFFRKTRLGMIGVRVEADHVVSITLPDGQAGIRATRGALPSLCADVFRQIEAFLDGTRKRFDFPFAVRGSDFQKRVWQALCEIPYGKTASYGDIAAKIGNPKAARAVGMACNANDLPLLIPCHRVVGSGRTLGGFATGTATKTQLLAIEGSLKNLKGYDGAFGVKPAQEKTGVAVVKKGEKSAPHEANSAPSIPPKRLRDASTGAASRPLSCSHEALAHLSAADTKLAAVIARMGPLEDRTICADVFAALVDSIVAQQISGKAAQTIGNRLLDLWKTVTPARILQTDMAAMRACGLSQRKTEYVLAAAQAAQNGDIDFAALRALSDDVIVQKLSSLRGIGVWTAQMLLIFSFGRPDIMSYLDLGIRKGLAKLHGQKAVETPASFARFQRRYSPYGSIASLYLWALAGE